MTRACNFKLPQGLSVNDRVVANKRYANAYTQSPKGRQGTIFAATARLDYVRIRWDGCIVDQLVHRNFFDLSERGKA